MTDPIPPWPPASPPEAASGRVPARPSGLDPARDPALPAAAADPEATLTIRAVRRPVTTGEGADPAAAPAEEARFLPHLRWPLLIAILTVQAVLSLHLVWSNTAYTDEAAYLLAGHLEIGHLLHGAPIPAFQTWFSGAPVIYPPVGAMADAIGGLTAARILSLVFMIGATALLWSTTSKLFGARAAFFAAGLFAVLSPTQFQGALATYDAMALLLMAGSVWCVVAAHEHRDSTLLLIAGIGLLALANATKYATVLFDPVVTLVAALVVAGSRGRKPALGRGGYFAASVIAVLAVLWSLGGPRYLTGILSTTLARPLGRDSPFLVLEDAAKWAGVVGILAWAGVVIARRRGGRMQALLLATLAAACLLAPLNQARLDTITSLPKNVDFGAWLAAPAAGYALAQLSALPGRRGLSRAVTAGLAAIVIAPVASLGWVQASSLFHGWPDFSQVIAPLRSQAQAHPGPYLAEDEDVPAYYLRGSVPWQRWSNTWVFSYTPRHGPPLTGTAAFRAAIRAHYFALIILDHSTTPSTDLAIIHDIPKHSDYQVAKLAASSSIGYYTIWTRKSSPRSAH